jgi:hypothetical protein
MKKIIIGLFFIFTNLSLTYTQSGIDEISLRFNHSMRIPHNEVTIQIVERQDAVTIKVKSEPLLTTEKKWEHTRIDTMFKISIEVFKLLEQAVLLIDGNNVVKGLDFTGMDGTTCEIKFGNYANAVTYQVWAVNYDTQKRKLESFLEACKLILKAGKLDPKEIL